MIRRCEIISSKQIAEEALKQEDSYKIEGFLNGALWYQEKMKQLCCKNVAFKATNILDSWNEARKYPEEKIKKALNYLKSQKIVIDACETKTDRLILDLVVLVDTLIDILEGKENENNI